MEYEEMREDFKKAKYAAFLVVPLKYDTDNINFEWLEKNGERSLLQTSDISESVRNLMNGQGKDTVLWHYTISEDIVLRNVIGESPEEKPGFYACDHNEIEYSENQHFTLHDIEFYIFHTKIAFMCVKIRCEKISAIDNMVNLGYVENNVSYYYENADGEKIEIDFEKKLLEICNKTGLHPFNLTHSSIFLEAYTYITAVVGRRFKQLETIRQATFNMHLMVDLPTPVEDESEEDIQFVYAVKDQSFGTYRWGSCITSQTISYIVARDDLDIELEMKEQAENGLPVVLLALFQKYTCLRYQAILSETEKFTAKKIKSLKKQLLEFQAFGTIAPANISRWHNIKQTYKHLLEENDIPDAIEKMSLSLNILADQQKEIAEVRSNAVMDLITVFGVVSIPSSVISIIDVMHGSNPINRLATILSLLSITIMIIVLILYKRED